MGLLSRLAQVSAAAGDEGSPVRTTVLVLTELVRWMAFVVPIYMAAWRWAEFQGSVRAPHARYRNHVCRIHPNVRLKACVLCTGV